MKNYMGIFFSIFTLMASSICLHAAIPATAMSLCNNSEEKFFISVAYEPGEDRLQRSTLRRKGNQGEHESVPAELMKWVWALEKKTSWPDSTAKIGIYPLPEKYCHRSVTSNRPSLKTKTTSQRAAL